MVQCGSNLKPNTRPIDRNRGYLARRCIMPDVLAVITRIISEHHAIREHVKLAGDTVNDIEALFTLQRTQSGWSQTSITALIEKQNRLLQTISFLEQGLKNHFGFEEKALPSL